MTINPEMVSLGAWICGLMLAQFIALWKKLSKMELRSEHFVNFEFCSEKRQQIDALRERILIIEGEIKAIQEKLR